MSTIDPARVRRERELRRRGSPGAATGIVIGHALILLGGASLGLAAGGWFGLGGFRDRALNHVFSDARYGDGPQTIESVALPVGIVLPMLGTFVLVAAARAYTGRIMSFPVVGPLTVGLAGFAAGLTVAVRQWPPPAVVGVRVDDTFGDDEAWSSLDWGWYHADRWIPWVAVALALLSLVLGILGRARRTARRRELDRLLVHGRRVIGHVTAIPVLTEGSALVAPWTVHFVDHALTDRWVTSRGVFPRDDLPRVGDRVTVLYDPADPGDQRRIHVGGTEAHTAEDFLRWRSA